ncbi:hypothetical protein GCM10027586_07850 [Kineococcus gypseus]|uniref:WapI family immunity protein n=1 Tax=Kineococcus gypseus TaxID=1637102 RepID=UPI003D7D86C7
MQLASTDGATFELSPIGYQFDASGTPGDWDANWLIVRGQVRTASGRSWTFTDPSLTTWEAQELGRWLHSAAQGQIEATAQPHEDDGSLLTFTEPNLAFSVAAVLGTQTLLRVHLSLEALPQDLPWTGRDGPALHEYSVPLTLERAQLRAAAAQWQDDLTPFPAR